MLKTSESKENSNELIIYHFILAIILLFGILIKGLNLIIPNPKSQALPLKKKEDADKKEISSGAQLNSSIISRKSHEELRKILKDVDILSSLDKSKLTDLILSNQDALDKLIVEIQKESLQRMTNQEIRSILKGVEGISRLRKSELIEEVLKQYKFKKYS